MTLLDCNSAVGLRYYIGKNDGYNAYCTDLASAVEALAEQNDGCTSGSLITISAVIGDDVDDDPALTVDVAQISFSRDIDASMHKLFFK